MNLSLSSFILKQGFNLDPRTNLIGQVLEQHFVKMHGFAFQAEQGAYYMAKTCRLFRNIPAWVEIVLRCK